MKLLSECRHASIIECYGMSFKDGHFFLLLQYMDAGTLLDLLVAHKSVAEPVLARVARDVLVGLDYLQRRRIVHRDVKPSNLLLNRRGEVKISDFSVSGEVRESRSKCASWVGTVTYMSPERLNGESYSFNSDVWSLGLVLTEAATGRYPYLRADDADGAANLTFWDLIELVIHGPAPSLPESFSPRFRDFVSRWCGGGCVCADCGSLDKDPTTRPCAGDLLVGGCAWLR
jgi:mitogen-activated protein kinase kinase 1